jgi:hypothetical protein
VFCFAVGAAFAAEWWIRRAVKGARWWILVTLGGSAASVLTLIGEQGGWGAMDLATAKDYVSATVAIIIVALLALLFLSRGRRLAEDKAGVLLTTIVVGELFVYVPLGNASPAFLWARIGIFLLMGIASLLLALGYTLPAIAGGGLVMAAYGALIVVPSVGLPRQFDVEAPPPFMVWLNSAAGVDFRSFGIVPDFSSLAGIKDIGVVGPLATNEFNQFVGLIASDASASTAAARTWTEPSFNASVSRAAAFDVGRCPRVSAVA